MGKCFFDCHCMISEPHKWIDALSDCGTDQVTFHYESEIGQLEDLILKIKAKGMRAGLALKPKTLLDHTITSILDKNLLDMVLVMTVGLIYLVNLKRAWTWGIIVLGIMFT